jgi:transposase-like protein
MPKPLDQALKNRVIQDRITNRMTIKEISNKYSISSSSINRWLKLHRETKKPKQELINITNLVKPKDVRLVINGYEVICDERALPQLLKGLKT